MAAGPQAPSGRRKAALIGFFWFVRTEQGGGGETCGFLQLLCTQLTGSPLPGQSRGLGAQSGAHLCPGHNQNPSCLKHKEGEETPLLQSTQGREQQSGLSPLQQPATKAPKEQIGNKYKKRITETQRGVYRKQNT